MIQVESEAAASAASARTPSTKVAMARASLLPTSRSNRAKSGSVSNSPSDSAWLAMPRAEKRRAKTAASVDLPAPGLAPLTMLSRRRIASLPACRTHPWPRVWMIAQDDRRHNSGRSIYS